MPYSKYLMILLVVFGPAAGFAQKEKPLEVDITGLWKGTIYNDSTRLYYRYEIGISKEKGKYTGFTHTWFILDDKQYYGVKKVKIRRENGKVIVQDIELIANNYPVPPAKGIHQLNILDLDEKDSIMKLTGQFMTNRTRDWAPVTGTVSLQRKSDYWQSSLVPHLQELGVVEQLSFVEDTFTLTKNTAAVTIKESKYPTNSRGIKNPQINKAPIDNPLPQKKQSTPAPTFSTIADVPKEVQVSSIVKEEENTAAAADVDNRTTVAQQIVYFKSDSLQLSLYDNGEVDGDTVSVLMNGEVIIAKQRLSTNAFRKTVYIEKGTDSIMMIMYAENLGSIPPNTGLLVVKDGKEIYEIRFSGDLQKNAAIIFRRKK